MNVAMDYNLVRRSQRQRKELQPHSPDIPQLQRRQPKKRKMLDKLKMVDKKLKPQTQVKIKQEGITMSEEGDYLPDGTLFSCDRCKTPWICNPYHRSNNLRQNRVKLYPRCKIDPITQKKLTLCNSCGLSSDKVKRSLIKPKIPASVIEAEKKKYLQEARTFAYSLEEGLNDSDASQLACPQFKKKPCGCLQKYIIGEGDMASSRNRASQLLQLVKEAKRLSRLKSYATLTEDSLTDPTSCKKDKVKIGIGNGQRKNKIFEEFVLQNRKVLREEPFDFCERGTQRILMYSNNFLHKRLKTDPNKEPRVIRQKGRAAMGLLKDVKSLAEQRCCVSNCVQLAATHKSLVEMWRVRALSGQRDSRRIIAEMLTPTGAFPANCYKFISEVTGACHSTISRVNDYMRITSGEREPPEHGLKNYWHQQQQTGATDQPEPRSDNLSSPSWNTSQQRTSAGPQQQRSSLGSTGQRGTSNESNLKQVEVSYQPIYVTDKLTTSSASQQPPPPYSEAVQTLGKVATCTASSNLPFAINSQMITSGESSSRPFLSISSLAPASRPSTDVGKSTPQEGLFSYNLGSIPSTSQLGSLNEVIAPNVNITTLPSIDALKNYVVIQEGPSSDQVFTVNKSQLGVLYSSWQQPPQYSLQLHENTFRKTMAGQSSSGFVAPTLYMQPTVGNSSSNSTTNTNQPTTPQNSLISPGSVSQAASGSVVLDTASSTRSCTPHSEIASPAGRVIQEEQEEQRQPLSIYHYIPRQANQELAAAVVAAAATTPSVTSATPPQPFQQQIFDNSVPSVSNTVPPPT